MSLSRDQARDLVHQPPKRQLHYEFAADIDPANFYFGVKPPALVLLGKGNSVVKLNQLMGALHPRGGNLFQPGDILRVSYVVGSKLAQKDIVIINFHVSDVGTPKALVLAIPPQGRQKSEPMLSNIIIDPKPTEVPADSPTNILRYLKIVDSTVNAQDGWNTISVLRPLGSASDLEFLGTLHDIRQAQAFFQLELEFEEQLAFLSSSRQRRLNRGFLDRDPGWYLAGNSCLFFKLEASKYLTCKKGAMLDFGDELNELLAKCATSPEHTIVAYDIRLMLQYDGIPEPTVTAPGTSIPKDGPMAFPTAYTRELAAANFDHPSIWSKGHAHAGPLSFGKTPFGRNRRATMLNGVPVVDTDPKGVEMTVQEKYMVDQFHNNYIQGRILHWPLPIHRDTNNGLDGGLRRKQFYVPDNKCWVEDDRGRGGIKEV